MENVFDTSRKLQARRRPAALAAFLPLALLTLLCAFLYLREGRDERLEDARLEVQEYTRILQQGTRAFSDINRALAAFVSASPAISQESFASFVATSGAFETHPGVRATGFVAVVPPGGAEAFERAARRNSPSFRLRGTRENASAYYPLLHVYPTVESALNLLGLDYSSIPERLDAMRRARDSGLSALTSRHTSVGNLLGIPVVLLFTPVYGASPNGGAAADGGLIGFTFSVFWLQELVDQILGEGFRGRYDLEIHAGGPGGDSLVYEGGERELGARAEDEFVLRTAIDFGDARWTLFFSPRMLLPPRLGIVAGLMMGLGLACSALLAHLASRWQAMRAQRQARIDQGYHLQEIFENHPFAVYFLDPQRCLMNANTKALQELEASKEEVIGMPIESFIAPENRRLSGQRWRQVLAGNAVTYDNVNVSARGRHFDVRVVLIPVTQGDEIIGALAITENITERNAAVKALFESRQMLQLVLDNIPQRVFWKDRDSVLLGGNRNLAADAGLDDPGEIAGKTDLELPWRAHADAYRKDDQEVMRTGVAKFNYEKRLRRDDGTEMWIRTSKMPLKAQDGSIMGVLGVLEDITEQKNLSARLEHMAYHDALTGLPNRAHLSNHLEQAIKKAHRHGTLLAVFYFDIDKFKQVNDRHGHDVGDKVITQFGRRVKSVLREEDMLGRLGGDEFALVLEGVESREAVERVAKKILAALEEPLAIDGLSLKVGSSVGIAFHRPEMSAGDLLRNADHAMYAAKEAGGLCFRTAS